MIESVERRFSLVKFTFAGTSELHHEFIEARHECHLMLGFNSRKETIVPRFELPTRSYSLITSVSIRRLPGDGEHIVFSSMDQSKNQSTRRIRNKSRKKGPNNVDDLEDQENIHDDLMVNVNYVTSVSFFCFLCEESEFLLWVWLSKRTISWPMTTKRKLPCWKEENKTCDHLRAFIDIICTRRPNEWMLRVCVYIYICLLVMIVLLLWWKSTVKKRALPGYFLFENRKTSGENLR